MILPRILHWFTVRATIFFIVFLHFEVCTLFCNWLRARFACSTGKPFAFLTESPTTCCKLTDCIILNQYGIWHMVWWWSVIARVFNGNFPWQKTSYHFLIVLLSQLLLILIFLYPFHSHFLVPYYKPQIWEIMTAEFCNQFQIFTKYF